MYSIGPFILCAPLWCPTCQDTQRAKALGFLLPFVLLLPYIGNGNSFYFFYIQISVLQNGRILREEFFTKNDSDIYGL